MSITKDIWVEKIIPKCDLKELLVMRRVNKKFCEYVDKHIIENRKVSRSFLMLLNFKYDLDLPEEKMRVMIDNFMRYQYMSIAQDALLFLIYSYRIPQNYLEQLTMKFYIPRQNWAEVLKYVFLYQNCSILFRTKCLSYYIDIHFFNFTRSAIRTYRKYYTPYKSSIHLILCCISLYFILSFCPSLLINFFVFIKNKKMKIIKRKMIGNDVWFRVIIPKCELRELLVLRGVNKRFYETATEVIIEKSGPYDYVHLSEEFIFACKDRLQLINVHLYFWRRKNVSQIFLNFILLNFHYNYFWNECYWHSYFHVVQSCILRYELDEKNLEIVINFYIDMDYKYFRAWKQIFENQHITPKLLNKYFMRLPSYEFIYYQTHLYMQLKNIAMYNRRIRRKVPFEKFYTSYITPTEEMAFQIIFIIYTYSLLMLLEFFFFLFSSFVFLC